MTKAPHSSIVLFALVFASASRVLADPLVSAT